LAHELRNPLAPIRNSIEIARGFDGGDRELAWAHDTIDRQVAHLTRLVDDLLDVSRITRGTLEIRREPVDLADVVRAAVEAIGPGMRGRRQQLHVTLPAAALPLEVDVVRMNQVLVNLLDNACKFTPEGGSVWLIVERDGPLVVLRVRDSG